MLIITLKVMSHPFINLAVLFFLVCLCFLLCLSLLPWLFLVGKDRYLIKSTQKTVSKSLIAGN